MGGLSFDLLAKLTGKKFSVSAVRVKKFCLPRSEAYRGATTQFDATKAHSSGFIAPFTLAEGLTPCITNLLIRKKMGLFLNRNKR